MSESRKIKPGTYLIDLDDYKDIESVSVKTNVVPKPPPRICVELEIAVVPKPPPGGAGHGKK